MIVPGSFQFARANGTTSVVEMAWSMGTTLPTSGGPCCRSTVRQSQPEWAITSAENELGTCSHPLRTTPPLSQMDLTLFSRTSSPPELPKTTSRRRGTVILCRTGPSRCRGCRSRAGTGRVLGGKLAGIGGRSGRKVGIMGVISSIDGLRVGEQALAFWGLGQVGVAIKGPEGVLYVDPYLTDSDGEGGSLERTFPPPVAPAEVTNASVVLLTHDHIDHTDPDTLLPMAEASSGVRFIAPTTSR